LQEHEGYLVCNKTCFTNPKGSFSGDWTNVE